MFFGFWRQGDRSAFKLVAGMVGVKMGDRVVQIGCTNGARLAGVAANAGLSGRAVVIAPDALSAERARKGAADAGVLVEIETAPSTRLPLDDASFDVAVIDDTDGLFGGMRAEDRVTTVRELLRILRPGGRAMVLGAAVRGGMGALITRAQNGPPFDPAPSLQADGFGAVRRLAEREGLVFVEGIKPR